LEWRIDFNTAFSFLKRQFSMTPHCPSRRSIYFLKGEQNQREGIFLCQFIYLVYYFFMSSCLCGLISKEEKKLLTAVKELPLKQPTFINECVITAD
jgi:hypothetical protein